MTTYGTIPWTSVPPMPHDRMGEPFGPKITKHFAWLPVKLKSGRLTWFKTIYYRKQIRHSDKGRLYYDKAWYSSEELAMLKLRGE